VSDAPAWDWDWYWSLVAASDQALIVIATGTIGSTPAARWIATPLRDRTSVAFATSRRPEVRGALHAGVLRNFHRYCVRTWGLTPTRPAVR
jgi:hypothetical protein